MHIYKKEKLFNSQSCSHFPCGKFNFGGRSSWFLQLGSLNFLVVTKTVTRH